MDDSHLIHTSVPIHFANSAFRNHAMPPMPQQIGSSPLTHPLGSTQQTRTSKGKEKNRDIGQNRGKRIFTGSNTNNNASSFIVMVLARRVVQHSVPVVSWDVGASGSEATRD